MKAVTAGEMVAILSTLPPNTPLVVFQDSKGEHYPVRKKDIKVIRDYVYFGGDWPANINAQEDDNGKEQPPTTVFQVGDAYN